LIVMPDITKEQILDALKKVIDPKSAKDVVSNGMINGLYVREGKVGFILEVAAGDGARMEPLRKACENAVKALPGVTAVTAVLTAERPAPGQPQAAQGQDAPGPKAHAAQTKSGVPGVQAIIAVASGKGGVGKSTVAVNLALGLKRLGKKVGILDADIYGPSQPTMLGAKMKPESKDGKSLEPIMSYHLQSMSIGYLVDEETPMIWRGPMVTQALEQLLRDTNWKDLDYLIVDLPPGTGDVQLTLAQKVPVSGAVIVTTPQDIALLDARKGLKMFEKVDIPVLGVIENMSTHICSKCGHEEHIFGTGGGQRMSEQNDVDFLGALPLDIRIREETDSGKPTVVADPECRISQIYRDIARRTAAKLSLRKKDFSAKFPSIVIQNT
jgi:ATP-binding protein involved in chromosome partitioning